MYCTLQMQKQEEENLLYTFKNTLFFFLFFLVWPIKYLFKNALTSFSLFHIIIYDNKKKYTVS